MGAASILGFLMVSTQVAYAKANQAMSYPIVLQVQVCYNKLHNWRSDKQRFLGDSKRSKSPEHDMSSHLADCCSFMRVSRLKKGCPWL
ncbi:hypothetical protein C5167_016628 [Papaver somniferum]|nr:hypothetical protein C5167_016628 [Papaver somniferum]